MIGGFLPETPVTLNASVLQNVVAVIGLAVASLVMKPPICEIIVVVETLGPAITNLMKSSRS
jgi:hypothetical protein